jgi:hypothetical protein
MAHKNILKLNILRKKKGRKKLEKREKITTKVIFKKWKEEA